MTQENRSMQVFFKYRHLRGKQARKLLKKYILKREVWFASPRTLNDPLDCLPSVTTGGKYDHDRTSAFFNVLDERTGVFSTSLNPTSVLQWSYYADGHTGVCFGINMRHEKAGRYQVKYSNERVKFTSEKLESLPPNEFEEQLIEAVTTKGKIWSHEQEYRFLKKGSGVKNFPAENLVSLYVGCNAQLEDIDWLAATIKRSNINPQIALMKRLDNFSLEIDPCAQDWDELKDKIRLNRV